MAGNPTTLKILNAQIVACNLCPRLREHATEVARVRRRAYADFEYWGKPVPSFGDEHARVLVLGLAPGAHGSNRTGRMFTGDGSGNFLFPVLYDAGFASQPNAVTRDDSMKLTDLWIAAVVRCAPPGNKPTPEEQRNCAPWLDQEIPLLKRLRVVVCLGRIAFDGLLAYAQRTGLLTSRSGLVLPTARSSHFQTASRSSPAITRPCRTPTPANSLAPCSCPPLPALAPSQSSHKPAATRIPTSKGRRTNG